MTDLLAAHIAMALDPVRLARRVGMKPDAWQADALRSEPERQLICVTRQGGKTRVGFLLALHASLFRPGSLSLVVSGTERQAQWLFQYALTAYRTLGKPIASESENRLSLQLENGCRIIVVPGTAANIRGYTVDLLLLDEAAFIPDETWMVAHAMTAVSGGRIVAMSTPYGRRGWFYEAWDSGDPRRSRVKVTADDCPRISRAYLEEAQRSMPGWFFQSEFYCEFLDAATSAFSSEDIERAFDERITEWKLWSSE